MSGKYMVVFPIFITRTTMFFVTKKVYGKGYGTRWWGLKNPKVTFITIHDHIFEKKRLLLQYHDENDYLITTLFFIKKKVHGNKIWSQQPSPYFP
jgi:hypothetical protein